MSNRTQITVNIPAEFLAGENSAEVIGNFGNELAKANGFEYGFRNAHVFETGTDFENDRVTVVLEATN